MGKDTRQQGTGSSGTFRERDLKLCPLCGWLNLSANPECFVCGWHGKFEQDSDALRGAIRQAEMRYGRLELDQLTDLRTYQEEAPSGFRSWLRRIWNWIRG